LPLIQFAVFLGPFEASAQSLGSDKNQYTLFDPTPRTFMRELNADRPDKTDGPFTVDAGHAQVEMDFANWVYDASNASHGKFETYHFAPMNIKLGLLNTIDVQLVLTPWQIMRSWNGGNRVNETSGFSGITPRAKINLLGNDGGFFALALIPFVTVPINENSDAAAGLGIPYAFDVPGWDVGLQSSIVWQSTDASRNLSSSIANSISIGHQLVGNLFYSGEFYCEIQGRAYGTWTETADTWFTYRMSDNLRFDGGIYIGITQPSDQSQLWVGMTLRD
ncbi:MAG TPA: transporter, partial [Candidatus Kapabacteria bacterium]|nr:transporter [Candidatus Kapabacteria bacterium]